MTLAGIGLRLLMIISVGFTGRMIWLMGILLTHIITHW